MRKDVVKMTMGDSEIAYCVYRVNSLMDRVFFPIFTYSLLALSPYDVGDHGFAQFPVRCRS